MAVQIVDNSVKMIFHGDQESDPVSSSKILWFIKANFYEEMCNCECGVREQVQK